MKTREELLEIIVQMEAERQELLKRVADNEASSNYWYNRTMEMTEKNVSASQEGA